MILQCGARTIDVSSPMIMGVVNTSPDSFSDAGGYDSIDGAFDDAMRLVAEGADILDIGGQSAITGVAEIPTDLELERVVPLVERLRSSTGTLLSVDTYRAAVARAALDAGADIINDVSGCVDPAMPELIARSGAGYVLMHTRWAPKQRLDARDLYPAARGGVVGDVTSFLVDTIARLNDAGVSHRQIVTDPGPDFSKTPAQTIAVLRALPAIHALGRPVLLALSRKDFIGALTSTRPRERAMGTVAAISTLLAAGRSVILRVHDVLGTRQAIVVTEALLGRSAVDDELRLDESLRRQNTKQA